MEQPSLEKVTLLLQQEKFPASIEATLMAIRECHMFTRTDLSMLANSLIFRHIQSPSPTNPSQIIWTKTLNNLQELHTLDLLRQFLEKQSDLKISTRIFDIIFVDIFMDQRHPLYSLYYNLIEKFLSLILSFQSKQSLTIIARWFLSLAQNQRSLLSQIVEQLIREHIALVISTSLENLSMVSPIFTLCLITQTSILFNEENFDIDLNTIQTLIELFTFSLTHSNKNLIQTLQDELNEKSKIRLFVFVLDVIICLFFSDDSFLANFLPSIIRLDLLFSLRSFESTTLRSHLERFHTSILSFLFSILTNSNSSQQTESLNYLPKTFFEQLPMTIQESIERQGPNKTHIDECIQRYFQLVSICRNGKRPLTQIRVRDLENSIPLFTRHRLFEMLKQRDQLEKKTTT